MAASRQPSPDGKPRPYLRPAAYLDRTAWQLVWRVVDYLRTREFDLYSRFLHERTIAEHIVDFYAEDAPRPTTLRAVVDELERIVNERRTWLVQIPIANAWPAAEVTELDPQRAVLIRADSNRNWQRFGTHLSDPFAVHRTLGDQMMIRPRWLSAPSPAFVDVDTRWSAAILFVEDGTDEVAVDVALARARIAIAVWTLLKRPQATKTRVPAWPIVSMWAPAPYLVHGPLHRPFSGEFAGKPSMRGNFIRELGLYRLPQKASALTAPLVGMREALGDNDGAIALLAAARWLYVADHEPSILTRPERLFAVYAARESLCQRGLRGQGGPEDRWKKLISRLRVRGHLRRRGFAEADIDAVLAEWSKDVRDVAAHRADSVLMALDFQTSRLVPLQGTRWGATLSRDDLALAVLTSRWPILLEAVRYSARKLLEQAIASQWDEGAFHSYLNVTPRRGPKVKRAAKR